MHPLPGNPVILIVDDEALVREVVALMIEESGARFVAAATGTEAVTIFQARDDIDLVILDFSMPGMNGYDTYLALSGLKPGVKVLMVSGLRVNNEAEDLIRRKVVRFLAKPFHEEELLNVLREMLG